MGWRAARTTAALSTLISVLLSFLFLLCRAHSLYHVRHPRQGVTLDWALPVDQTVHRGGRGMRRGETDHLANVLGGGASGPRPKEKTKTVVSRGKRDPAASAKEMDDGPLHLCPVDLRKLLAVLGGDGASQAASRYRTLQAFCRELGKDSSRSSGWRQEDRWLEDRLSATTAGENLQLSKGYVESRMPRPARNVRLSDQVYGTVQQLR